MPTAAAESKECRDNVSSSGPLPGLSLHLIHICWLTLVLKQFPYYQTVVVVGTCFLSFLHFFFSSFSYHCPSSHLPLLSLTRKVYRNHTDLCPLCWLMFNPFRNQLTRNSQCDISTQLENQWPWDHSFYVNLCVHHFG